MIKKIEKYISENDLFSKEDKLILAISGGMDSVFLMHMLLELEFRFELAHCNFQLRSDDSDKDEEFIKELASKYNLKIHSILFNTKAYALKQKISIQMAARYLRYDWLNNLLASENANYIVTAHHKQDSAETFLINLIRGSGISGLMGIPLKKENIRRPILNIDRIEIEKYMKMNKIFYREDNSNKSVKYIRNKIRHNILPIIKEINPNIENTILKEASIFRHVKEIITHETSLLKKSIISQKGDAFYINIKKLKSINPLHFYLFEILKPFGFKTIELIIDCLNSGSGKCFYSLTHRLIIDRKHIIITKISNNSYMVKKVYREDKKIIYPIPMIFSIKEDVEINKLLNTAELDFNKLTFPLTIRKWRKGDKFKPLGMYNYKKLSDFFIDNKFSILDKESQWLLCSEDNIVWVIGHRIDDRYKVESTTKKLYIAKVL